MLIWTAVMEWVGAGDGIAMISWVEEGVFSKQDKLMVPGHRIHVIWA